MPLPTTVPLTPPRGRPPTVRSTTPPPQRECRSPPPYIPSPMQHLSSSFNPIRVESMPNTPAHRSRDKPAVPSVLPQRRSTSGPKRPPQIPTSRARPQATAIPSPLVPSLDASAQNMPMSPVEAARVPSSSMNETRIVLPSRSSSTVLLNTSSVVPTSSAVQVRSSAEPTQSAVQSRTSSAALPACSSSVLANPHNSSLDVPTRSSSVVVVPAHYSSVFPHAANSSLSDRRSSNDPRMMIPPLEAIMSPPPSERGRRSTANTPMHNTPIISPSPAPSSMAHMSTSFEVPPPMSTIEPTPSHTSRRSSHNGSGSSGGPIRSPFIPPPPQQQQPTGDTAAAAVKEGDAPLLTSYADPDPLLATASPSGSGEPSVLPTTSNGSVLAGDGEDGPAAAPVPAHSNHSHSQSINTSIASTHNTNNQNASLASVDVYLHQRRMRRASPTLSSATPTTPRTQRYPEGGRAHTSYSHAQTTTPTYSTTTSATYRSSSLGRGGGMLSPTVAGRPREPTATTKADDSHMRGAKRGSLAAPMLAECDAFLYTWESRASASRVRPSPTPHQQRTGLIAPPPLPPPQRDSPPRHHDRSTSPMTIPTTTAVDVPTHHQNVVEDGAVVPIGVRPARDGSREMVRSSEVVVAPPTPTRIPAAAPPVVSSRSSSHPFVDRGHTHATATAMDASPIPDSTHRQYHCDPHYQEGATPMLCVWKETGETEDAIGATPIGGLIGNHHSIGNSRNTSRASSYPRIPDRSSSEYDGGRYYSRGREQSHERSPPHDMSLLSATSRPPQATKVFIVPPKRSASRAPTPTRGVPDPVVEDESFTIEQASLDGGSRPPTPPPHPPRRHVEVLPPSPTRHTTHTAATTGAPPASAFNNLRDLISKAAQHFETRQHHQHQSHNEWDDEYNNCHVGISPPHPANRHRSPPPSFAVVSPPSHRSPWERLVRVCCLLYPHSADILGRLMVRDAGHCGYLPADTVASILRDHVNEGSSRSEDIPTPADVASLVVQAQMSDIGIPMGPDGVVLPGTLDPSRPASYAMVLSSIASIARHPSR